MNLSMIADEYTHDPFTAFELGTKWGVRHYEIRYAYRWRVPNAPGWVAERVAAAVKAYGVSVTAVSPGLFKPVMKTDGTKIPISVDTPDEIRRHIDQLLPSYFEFAEQLNTKTVIVFALPKPNDAAADKPPPIVIDTLAESADKAARAGFQLLLENGPGSWADTARATKALLDAVGADALQLTWDPANVVYGNLPEDPVAEGYPLVKSYVRNVHVKDAALVDGKGVWRMLGDGAVDWPSQIDRLRQDDYAGFLTLEPHLQYESQVNLVEKIESFLSRLRELIS